MSYQVYTYEEMKEIPTSVEQLESWAKENYLEDNPQVVVSALRSCVMEKQQEVHVDKPVSKPTMARMTGKNEKEKAEKLLQELAEYEKLEKRIKKQRAKRSEIGKGWGAIAEAYIKKKSGLDTIPEKYRAKVWAKAWDYGHANGYGEVYHYLTDLIEIFN